jgi:ligand-binding sensor domain-containing protein/two-component sensor histidine kinase
MNATAYDAESRRARPSGEPLRRVWPCGRWTRVWKSRGGLWLAVGLMGLGGAFVPAVAGTNGVLPYSVRVWQTDEGLPHNSVTALAQSRDGYLWVGTQQGLARFDGLHFTPVDEPSAPELKHGSITALCAGRDGSLWIGCAGKGVIRLQAGKFSYLTEAEGLPSAAVSCLLEDHEGSLWIGTEGGLTRYRLGKLTIFTDKQRLGDNWVRGLCEDRQGLLQVATRRGLSTLKENRIIGTTNFSSKWTANALRFVSEDRKGNLWTGSNDGLYCLEAGQQRFYGPAQGLPTATVNTVYEDHAGQLWIGTFNGLVRMVDGQVVERPPGEQKFWDKVFTIFEDREQTLWVGAEDGLYRLTPARFWTLTQQQGLTDNKVMSVCEDRDQAIWIATWLGGVNRLQDGQLTAYTTTNGLMADKVLALHQSRDGRVWVGMEDPGGLNCFQGEGRSWLVVTNGLLPSADRVIYEDRQGALWIGSRLGLNVIRNGRVDATYTHTNGLAPGEVMAICEDAQGQLWIGTTNGLSCWNGKDFKNFTPREGLSHPWVNALYEDGDQTLWIGTRGGGLNRYKDGVFKAVTTRQGLFSDEVYEIVEDDYGFFWMTCRNGLFRVARKELERAAGETNRPVTCTAFGKVDGLLTAQFNGVAKPAGWKSHDGRLWFSSIRGVVAVECRIPPNRRPPTVAIEQVMADRKVVADFRLGVLGGEQSSAALEVPPGHGELELTFTALSLQASEKNRFKYMLENYDSGWNEAGTERQVRYNRVSPGRYRFKVQACNNDGVWNLEGVTLAIVLRPHFWQTWWFKASIAAAVGLILTVAYRVRMARLQGIERLRVQIAANLHDDVGARLTKMTMVTEFADRETAETDPAKPHLRTLSRTTREIIQAMDEIVWTINPKNDNLDDLANYIFHYAQEYFQSTSVSCRLDFPAQLPDWPISTEARHNLFMVVKEALNNVLKHAAATEVQVGLTAGDGKMTITIADNGVGFDPGKVRARGNGLENMRARLSRIGGRLVLESHPGQGTSLRLEAKGG